MPPVNQSFFDKLLPRESKRAVNHGRVMEQSSPSDSVSLMSTSDPYNANSTRKIGQNREPSLLYGRIVEGVAAQGVRYIFHQTPPFALPPVQVGSAAAPATRRCDMSLPGEAQTGLRLAVKRITILTSQFRRIGGVPDAGWRWPGVAASR